MIAYRILNGDMHLTAETARDVWIEPNVASDVAADATLLAEAFDSDVRVFGPDGHEFKECRGRRARTQGEATDNAWHP